MAEILEQISKHKYKRDCYAAYTQKPEQYIDNLIHQQNQLLKVFNFNLIISYSLFISDHEL